MRLLYLGFILCLEITSPNGATVGKKPVVFVLHCDTRESMTTFFFFSSPCKASVHRPELEPTPQIGCLLNNTACHREEEDR